MSTADKEAYAPVGWNERGFELGMLEEIEAKHAALDTIASVGGRLADVAAAIRGLHGTERLRYFLDEMHLSPAGHALVASVLAPLVAERADRPGICSLADQSPPAALAPR